MSTWTILFLFEVGFRFATASIVAIAGAGMAITRCGININSAEFLPTFPTPASATTGSYNESTITGGKTTRKNVIARVVL